MNGEPRMRTPGRSAEVAQPPAIVPVDLERLGEDVAQEAEPRYLYREPVAVGLDVENLHREQIARLGTGHVDGAGERVHDIQVGRGHVVQRAARAHLPVEGVPGLQHDLVPGLTAHHRGDVRMPAVVAGPRLLGQGLAPVDPDFVGCHSSSSR
jgi:hypothetical protein